jgi:hypothetical protein
VTPDSEVLLHDVQDHGELCEDQDSVLTVLHLGQEVVHDGKLAAVADLVVAQTVVLNALKKTYKHVTFSQIKFKFPLLSF